MCGRDVLFACVVVCCVVIFGHLGRVRDSGSSPSLGFRVYGLRFTVYGLRFTVSGSSPGNDPAPQLELGGRHCTLTPTGALWRGDGFVMRVGACRRRRVHDASWCVQKQARVSMQRPFGSVRMRRWGAERCRSYLSLWWRWHRS